MVRVRARVRRQAVPGVRRYCPATIGTGARWWRLVGVKVRVRVGAYWGWVGVGVGVGVRVRISRRWRLRCAAALTRVQMASSQISLPR